MTSVPVSNKQILAGRIIGVLTVLFLVFDVVIHLIKPAPVVEAFTHLGWPTELSVGIGILELVGIVAYVIPGSSVLGAIFLTAYLGGATATLVRIGDPFYFPVGVGVLVWAALYLRDDRVRALLPWRRSTAA